MTSNAVASFLACLLLTTTASAQRVEVIKSAGPGAWGNNLRLVEELRIGELEGAEHYTFGPIRDLAVSKDRMIVVAESNPALLRVYDASGKFVKKIGRIGNGPGEYQQITGVKAMADGNLAVHDARVGRISVFDAQGNFLRSHNLSTGFYTSDMFRVDDAGNFYVKARATPLSHEPGARVDADLIWIRVSPTGQVVDSIVIPAWKAQAARTYGGPHFNQIELLSTLSSSGTLVTGNPLTYAFEVQRRSQPTLRVEREFQPLRIAGDEKTEWEAMSAFLSKEPSSRTFTSGRDGKPLTIDGPTVKHTIPSVKPAFRRLKVDDEGRIWVERFVVATKQPPPPPVKLPPGALPPAGMVGRPVSLWREPTTFDVFEPTGKFLGTVTQPPNTRFMVMRGRHIWGVASGELDEAYVVRYRIEPAK